MRKLTTCEFVDKAKSIHKNYDFSKFIYVDAKTKSIVGCPVHGEFNSTPDKLVNSKHGCPKCGGRVKLTTKEFISKVELIHPNYKWELVDYKNHYEKVKVICNIHGIFNGTPTHLLQGVGCPKCGGNIQSNTLEFTNKIKLIHPNYKWELVDYKNNYTKVKVVCPAHGAFEATPQNLLKGKGCPRCKDSKGEKFVERWLKRNGLDYTPQKRFITCKDKKPLPFDFYINDSNILIEYDGEQHFVPVKYWGGIDGLNNIIRRDNIKNLWAVNNKYIVIRLNYLMNNEEKLKNLENIKNHILIDTISS